MELNKNSAGTPSPAPAPAEQAPVLQTPAEQTPPEAAAAQQAPANPAPPGGSPPKKRSPILIYILIMFIAAFVLMSLSLISNQGEQQQELTGILTDHAAMAEKLQAALEENMQLKKQVSSLTEEVKELEEDLDAAHLSMTLTATENDELQKHLDAMNNLYLLEGAYRVKDYISCISLIQTLERTGLIEYLQSPGAATGDASSDIYFPHVWTAPHIRFEYIKKTVEDSYK